MLLHLTQSGRQQAEAARTPAPQLLAALETLPPADRDAMQRGLVGLIRALQEARVIPVQRMCVTCAHFRPHAHDDAGDPAPFEITHARITTKGHVATFHMAVSGKAGESRPAPTGALAGSTVFAYVWPTALDMAGEIGPVPRTMAAYALDGAPTLLLIDRAGRLRARHFGQVPDLELGVEIMGLVQEAVAGD